MALQRYVGTCHLQWTERGAPQPRDADSKARDIHNRRGSRNIVRALRAASDRSQIVRRWCICVTQAKETACSSGSTAALSKFRSSGGVASMPKAARAPGVATASRVRGFIEQACRRTSSVYRLSPPESHGMLRMTGARRRLAIQCTVSTCARTPRSAPYSMMNTPTRQESNSYAEPEWARGRSCDGERCQRQHRTRCHRAK